MTESSNGIILRRRLLTETSLIINWLTPEHGRISTVAKGARRQKSPFRGKLDLFYEADFSFQRSRRSDLHTLREIVLRDTHIALRSNLCYLQQASYSAALIEQTTERDTPLPGIFGLLQDFLNTLPLHPPQSRNIFAFELKLLNELGLKPDLEKSQLTAATKTLMSELVAGDWPAISELKATAAQAKELRLFLQSFLSFNLGKVPKQRTAAIGS